MLTPQTRHCQKLLAIEILSGIDGSNNSILISANAPLEELLDQIAKVLHADKQDIIILYGPPFKHLDRRKNAAVDLRDKEVYCFSRRTLRKHAPVPDPVMLPQPLPLPDSPRIKLDAAVEQCLQSPHNPLSFHPFQMQSLHNLSICEALCTRAELLLQPCRACNQESRVLLRALAAAHGNLDKHASSLSKSVENFSTSFTSAQHEHQDIIEGFTRDLENLGSIQLHVALRSAKRHTLLDCVPVDRLQNRCSQCRRYACKLQSMMQELRGFTRATVTAVQLELKKKAPPDVDIDALERQTLQDGTDLKRQQQETVDEIGAGYRRMMNSLESGVAGQSHSKFIEKLVRICTAQQQLVDKCNDNERRFQCLAERAAAVKSNVQHFTHKRMRSVSVLQSRIREQVKRMSALREALEQQFRAMRELQHVKKMPRAYFKSLLEVVQRRVFQKHYRAQVNAMGTTMAQMHEKEVMRRELFIENHGQHLPKDLIPGLSSQPQPCEIRARAFDESLPVIDNVSEPDFLPSRSGFADYSSSSEQPSSSVILPASGVWPNHEEARAQQTRLIQLECENAKLRAKLISVQMCGADPANHRSTTSSTSSENSFVSGTMVSAPNRKNNNRDCSSSSSSVSGSMGSASLSRVYTEEYSVEQMLELQTSLRTEREANAIHQKQIQALERRLHLQSNTQDSQFSSAGTEAGQHTITLLERECSHYREGLQQVATILDESVNLDHSSDSGATEPPGHMLVRMVVQSAKASAAKRGDHKFQNLCASIAIPECERKLASADPVSVFVQKYRLLEGKLQIAQQELLQAHKEAREINLKAESRISFERFTVGCVALFLRTSGKASDDSANSIYVAFHRACPRRFLSAESIEQCQRGSDPGYILGRVIFIEPKVADEDTIFPVPVGETYYLLTAAVTESI